MAAHTTTGEWQSFEDRMRLRRAERLVLRAEAAAEAGCLEDARQCLSEARALAPHLPALDVLEGRLSPPPPVEVAQSRRRGLAIAAIVATVATAAVAGVIVFPRSQPMADPIVAPPAPAAPATANPTAPAQTPAGEPLPPPIERFASETDAAAVAAATPRPPEPAPAVPTRDPAPVPVKSTGAEINPRPAAPVAPAIEAPVPAPPVTPVASGVSESIRQEVSAIASRTSGFPEVPPAAVLTPPATAAPVPPAVVPAPEPSQEPAIRSVLNRYAAAYSALDVDAAQRVWPGVNRGSLGRAFDSLASQQVSFADCRIDANGGTATAQCSGTATWSPKVGGGGSRTEPRNWTFELARRGTGWEIVSARVQNR